ncbi:hypothetical protein DQ244_03400 [Blastococcus sp. TBT05-19]|uniref:hypothetical protein n=1 Tax=Blastococcus sp. TBT05-19 TaxID=2250581 RepID=UPI000DE836EF|nr:hypothetical protein [Blastococcus sp. TBT05-19]RBY94378.1 hypothetical protein DQ244_03400 [Blastococcus sp. TBT05-19]
MTSVRAAAVGLGAVAVAGWLALVEVFWLPLRVGGVPVPVSVLAAVAGNVLLVRAALHLSGSRVVAALPAVVWLVVAVAGMGRRPEGDLVITSGAVNLTFLAAGVVAAAFSVGLVLGGPRGRVRPEPAPSGSGTGGAR